MATGAKPGRRGSWGAAPVSASRETCQRNGRKPADGVFRDRVMVVIRRLWRMPFPPEKGCDDRYAVCLHHLQGR